MLMKNLYKALFTIALFLGVLKVASAQTVSEVLEDSKIIKKEESLFFSYKQTKVEYGIGSLLPRFEEYSDMSLFLPVEQVVFIYVKPVNPLLYSFGNSIEYKPDPIIESAKKSFESSQSILSQVMSPTKAGGVQQECDMTALIEYNEQLINLLQQDIFKDIRQIFQDLKSISFDKRTTTELEIQAVKKKMEPLTGYIQSLKLATDKLDSSIKELKCNKSDSNYANKYIFDNALAMARGNFDQRTKKVDNLQKALDAVEGAMKEASAGQDGFTDKDVWFVKFAVVSLQKSKVSLWTINIYENEYKISEEGDITNSGKKEVDKKTIVFRRFQRFIAEPSAGVAFTRISFPSFKTVVNENNEHIVADAGSENFRRINVSAMVNYNYFLQNSDIVPFFQMGVGINSAYPTLFLGLGGRMNLPDLKRLAVSFGIASTWVKTLNTLKIGDVVGGEADVEKDISYEFSWPVKPYVGIQINF
jgi:hypothetical protein